MGFHEFSSPYDWSRIASFKRTAKAAFGGMIDLSVGSPVDPVPDSVRKALGHLVERSERVRLSRSRPAPPICVPPSHEWFAAARNVDLTCDRRRRGADGRFQGRRGADGRRCCTSARATWSCSRRCRTRRTRSARSWPARKALKVDDVADADSWKDVPGVKAIWVNSPCNPTGEVLSAEQMAGIVRAARAIGAVVLSDECYALMQWEDDVAEADADTLASTPCALRADVCGGSARRRTWCCIRLSKQSNMAGYRTALIAGDQVADRADGGIPQTDRADHSRTGAGCDGRRDCATLDVGQDRSAPGTQERLGHAGECVCAPTGTAPTCRDGALYVWVKAKSGDCWEDLRQLAEIGIVASPGEFYGAPEYLRFSATASDAAIASAAERLAR